MYQKIAKGWLKHLDFIIIDLIVLQTSFFISYVFRHGWENPYESVDYAIMAVLIMVFSFSYMTLANSFKNVLKRGYYLELIAVIRQAAILLFGTTFYLFVAKEGSTYSRITILLTILVYAVCTYVARVLWKPVIKSRMKFKAKRRLLVLVDESLLEETLTGLVDNTLSEYEVTGLVLLDKDAKGEKREGISVVANVSDVFAYATRGWIDEIFINTWQSREALAEWMAAFREMGYTVHAGVMQSKDAFGRKQEINKFGNYMVITNGINYMSPIESLWKRGLDIVGGLVGCFFTLVFAIIIGPIIYIQSPGPIFFKQERVGKNGKRFYMYKFRSMYLDAEERKKELMEQNRNKDGMMFKLDWDPRIIGSKILPDGTHKKGIGNFIRDWSIDEFPQFFNVLKGDMSLVGTRPPTVDEWEKYEKNHRVRLAMRPGITGLWQVSGRSNITDFEEVVKLDTQYILDWNMAGDLRILFKTVRVVFGQNGAM